MNDVMDHVNVSNVVWLHWLAIAPLLVRAMADDGAVLVGDEGLYLRPDGWLWIAVPVRVDGAPAFWLGGQVPPGLWSWKAGAIQ